MASNKIFRNIMGADYKEINVVGGWYDNPDVTIRDALHNILKDLKSQLAYNGTKENIQREDDLFNAFNEDGLHIGAVKVDINPITSQRTGTLETYLPQVEDYLVSIRAAREQEAIAIWKQIPPERMNGIPAIDIDVHRPGEESYMDDEIDLFSGKRIDLEILDHIPSIKNESKAMEARVWEMRMPDLTPVE